MHKMVKDVLYTYEQIVDAAKKIAGEIDKISKKADKPVILVGILKGAIPFYSLVLKHCKEDIETDFMLASSYHGGTESSGSVKIILDLNTPVKGREVVLVEDIVDTGRTLTTLTKIIKANGASNVYVATMLDKPENRKVEFKADFVGYTIKNEFVIGFGLDLDERLRNLPYIATCKEELLEEFLNEYK